MERKLTAPGILCFLALFAGLLIGRVSCLPMGWNFPTAKTNLDLKVEVVSHDGQIKKYMSFVNYSSWDSNGVLRTQVVQIKLDNKDPRLVKYTDFFKNIPLPVLLPATANATTTTCSSKDDIRLNTNNLSLVWAPQKMEGSYTGLLTQCRLNEPTTVLTSSSRQGMPWYLDVCSSGIRSVNLPPSGSPKDTTFYVTKPAFPVYTIYLSTTDQIMVFNPLTQFNVRKFVMEFPFKLMEINTVVTWCNAGNNANLKTGMRLMSYEVNENLTSSTIVFVKKPKTSAAVPGKPIGHLSLLLGIVGIGMELQLGLLSGYFLW